MTQKNRNEIKNGQILILCASAAKRANDLTPNLKSKDVPTDKKQEYLKELSQLSKDLSFSIEFINRSGHQIIVDMIESPTTPLIILEHSLECFVELMEHGIISWETLNEAFIHINTDIILNPKKYNVKCVEYALSNVENVIQNGSESKYYLIDEKVKMTNIFKILDDHEGMVIRQNCIAVINALFQKGDPARKKLIAKLLSTIQFRDVILKIVKMKEIGHEMAHQLHVLQTLKLGLMENRLRAVWTPEDTDSQKKILDLKNRAFREALNNAANNAANNLYPIPNIKEEQYYKKLGFQNTTSPGMDFTVVPPGLLALDCMIYFAINFSIDFMKVIHASAYRSDEHECPFARSSIELIRVLCDVFRIGEQHSDQSIEYQPMLFKHEHAFEEIFCICIPMLNKTWKDMRATTEDFDKVLSVCREQIIRTLRTKPTDFDDFCKVISGFSYSKINALRQQERTSLGSSSSAAPAISELRNNITPDILNLIKLNRLGHMIEGARFQKYTRGTRSKDKYWFARLSPNYKILHYGDCDEKATPTIEELTQKIEMCDVKQLLVGKDCPNMKDKAFRKSAVNLAFSISYESTEHSTLDFVASDEETFNRWTDGFNAMLGQKMVSEECKKDFDILMGMEIEIRLMEIEGIDIPSERPPTPEPPENMNFYFKADD